MTARQTHETAIYTSYQIHEYATQNLPLQTVRDLGIPADFHGMFHLAVDIALAVRGISRTHGMYEPGAQVLSIHSAYPRTVIDRAEKTLHLRHDVDTEEVAPANAVITVAAWEIIASDVLEAALRLRGAITDAIKGGRETGSEKTTSETGAGKMTRKTGEVIDFGTNEVLVRIRDRWHVVNLTETQVFNDYAMESLIEEVESVG